MKTINTQKTIKLVAIIFISALSFTACSDDHDHDDHDDHEHEDEITQVVYTLTNTSDAKDTVTFTFTDEDGEGGAEGTPNVVGSLKANTSYTGVLKLKNLEDNEDVSAEIIEMDAEDHEVFYTTDIAGLVFTTTDEDANGHALGFENTATTANAGSGSLTISVIHEAKKPNDGTITDALSGAGTTDTEVSFKNISVSGAAVLEAVKTLK
ncbi:type 1 periplasmic binding fold superfamily protein [uncultured Polaribacter sp.]|uniref:type 1 periplasmic binding fold superfamily protein n=1 Tax=uncultured Polaribacter sp. TaxID=174711 RepID=UPI002602B5DC|nr:type 1 periplasmic binding fold superfamily protein [uncultured Polaribacter sp.]